MVDRPLKLDSRFSCHAAQGNGKKPPCQPNHESGGLTPFPKPYQLLTLARHKMKEIQHRSKYRAKTP
jgi:hypothetical protein